MSHFVIAVLSLFCLALMGISGYFWYLVVTLAHTTPTTRENNASILEIALLLFILAGLPFISLSIVHTFLL